ncbi:MAG: type II secretion system secretin GspD [Spongiibacteraceae bacterium]
MRQAFPNPVQMRLLAGVLWIFLVNAPLVSAAPSSSAGLVTMNMRDADVRALIQWIAEQTHKQIVIDPRVQGRVSVFADEPVSIEQAYQIFLAALQTQGYATSETDGVLKIFPVPLAQGGPREQINDAVELTAKGQVMHVLNVQNVMANALAELIKPLLSRSGYAAQLPNSNSLVVADDGDSVRQIVELARRLDSDGNLDIDLVKLQHANARDIAQVLAPLTQTSGNTGSSANGPMALSIAADEHSNSILLAGDPASRQRARQLVRQLDQPISTTGFTRVVFLNYLTAEELVPVLKGTTGAEQKDAKEQVLRQAEISIEASKSANALVLTGPAELLDSMQETIASLDIRRSQVLVQAVIVEVSQELANSLGVQWNTDFSSNGTQAGTNFGLAPTAVAIAAAGANPISALGSGLTLGYLRNGSLRALINALATQSDANLLSTPSVMTLDNQEAEIIVGSNIPVITGQSTSDASGTLTPFTTFERRDIGVTLRLTPQINRDKGITLDVLQEVQSVVNTQADPAFAQAQDIVTNKRSISTKVIVADNDMLVLGGLISDEDEKQVSKVPVLGDMPLIGRLFRSTTTKIVKRNLMVFIHPTIVDDNAVAENLSRTQYDAVRAQQQQSSAPQNLDKIERKTLPEFETFKPRDGAAAAP